MLEEAQFTLMGFIKGPVCRGQVALNVINDHFWVVFVEPELEQCRAQTRSSSRSELNNLRLPAEDESTTGLLKWQRYAAHEAAYPQGEERVSQPRLGARSPPTLRAALGRRRHATRTPRSRSSATSTAPRWSRAWSASGRRR